MYLAEAPSLIVTLTVFDFRCAAAPGDSPYAELHESFSLSYVRKGSFGYLSRGRSFELVAGSLLVGHRGDEYLCTHDHVHGDECLSFHFAPDWVEAIGGTPALWRVGSVAPLAELMVLGELASAGMVELFNVAVGMEVASALVLLLAKFLDQALVVRGDGADG